MMTWGSIPISEMWGFSTAGGSLGFTIVCFGWLVFWEVCKQTNVLLVAFTTGRGVECRRPTTSRTYLQTTCKLLNYAFVKVFHYDVWPLNSTFQSSNLPTFSQSLLSYLMLNVAGPLFCYRHTDRKTLHHCRYIINKIIIMNVSRLSPQTPGMRAFRQNWHQQMQTFRQCHCPAESWWFIYI